MKSKLEQIKKEALKAIEKVADVDTLLSLEKKFLGRKADLTELVKQIGVLAEKERPLVGQLINNIKGDISALINNKRSELTKDFSAQGGPNHPLEGASGWDHTLPGIKPARGRLHPITQFLEKIEDIFVRLGYEIVEGPEVESQKYNFDLLNVPKDHPARDIQDTFYLDAKDEKGEPQVLRTHTSPVQIRAMETRRPPVRLLVPGRVFRNEATDAGHETSFYQVEGLVIDKNIAITDLIGTLDLFIKRLFGEKVNPHTKFGVGVKIRVRPHYYPFTEPSLDVDMSCLLCGGPGCAFCKQTGWIETLGSGMVHPQVLKNMKVDPAVYSGFAFGLGLDRLMMLYYGIDDIRLSYSGDLRFIEQF